MIVSLWKTCWRLSAGKKTISFFTFFLGYCKNVVNVYFGHVWMCTPKIKLSTFWNFCVYLQARKYIHPPCFCGDIARIYKLTLSTLDMAAWTHLRWKHQLVEDLDVYLHVKNKLQHSLFSWDIIFWRILQFDLLKEFWPTTRVFRNLSDMRLAAKYQ